MTRNTALRLAMAMMACGVAIDAGLAEDARDGVAAEGCVGESPPTNSAELSEATAACSAALEAKLDALEHRVETLEQQAANQADRAIDRVGRLSEGAMSHLIGMVSNFKARLRSRDD